MGIYDVFSATIAARHFDAVFLSGYGFTASHYGLPDEGYVTWVDIVDFCSRVRSMLPSTHIIVDIDDGYGDEKMGTSVARRLEQAGASAVVFEDQRRPKKCGHLPGKEVLPIETYLPRLDALLQARRDLFVIARTDAGFEEGVIRAQAYANSGADAVLVDGLSSLDQIKQIRDQIPDSTFLTVNLIRGGKTPPVSLSELERQGVNLVIYSTPCLFAAQEAIENSMRQMLHSDCLLDSRQGRIQLNHNNQVLLDNRTRAEFSSAAPVAIVPAMEVGRS
jgi:2-methylisocitrate lyase-like PEP mutase family enzyme